MAINQIFTTLMLVGIHGAAALVQTPAGRQCTPVAANNSPVCVGPSNSALRPLVCSDNLIQNPDFQTETGSIKTFSTDGWKLCSKSPYSTIRSAPGPESDPNGYSLELAITRDLDTIASFSQTFPTSNGVEHAFTIHYKVSNTDGTSVTCTFNNAGGTVVSLVGSHLSTGWDLIQGSFVASSGLTELSCTLEATKTTTADFDNVQVHYACVSPSPTGTGHGA